MSDGTSPMSSLRQQESRNRRLLANNEELIIESERMEQRIEKLEHQLAAIHLTNATLRNERDNLYSDVCRLKALGSYFQDVVRRHNAAAEEAMTLQEELEEAQSSMASMRSENDMLQREYDALLDERQRFIDQLADVRQQLANERREHEATRQQLGEMEIFITESEESWQRRYDRMQSDAHDQVVQMERRLHQAEQQLVQHRLRFHHNLNNSLSSNLEVQLREAANREHAINAMRPVNAASLQKPTTTEASQQTNSSSDSWLESSRSLFVDLFASVVFGALAFARTVLLMWRH